MTITRDIKSICKVVGDLKDYYQSIKEKDKVISFITSKSSHRVLETFLNDSVAMDYMAKNGFIILDVIANQLPAKDQLRISTLPYIKCFRYGSEIGSIAGYMGSRSLLNSIQFTYSLR